MLSTLKPFSLLQTLIQEVDKAQGIEPALDVLLRIICHRYYWPYGEVWQINPETDRLEKQATFSEANTTVTVSGKAAYLGRFAQISNSISFSIGNGMPGRIWASQQWEWQTNVSNVSADIFVRHQVARAFGIKTAFGIPLIDNGRTVAVLMLFSHHALTQNLELIETIKAVSGPISQLMNRQQTEQQIEKRELRVRKAIEHSPNLVFMKDRWGNLTYVNPRIESGFNLNSHRLLGKADYSFLLEGIAEKIQSKEEKEPSTQQGYSLIKVVPIEKGLEHRR